MSCASLSCSSEASSVAFMSVSRRSLLANFSLTSASSALSASSSALLSSSSYTSSSDLRRLELPGSSVRRPRGSTPSERGSAFLLAYPPADPSPPVRASQRRSSSRHTIDGVAGEKKKEDRASHSIGRRPGCGVALFPQPTPPAPSNKARWSWRCRGTVGSASHGPETRQHDGGSQERPEPRGVGACGRAGGGGRLGLEGRALH